LPPSRAYCRNLVAAPKHGRLLSWALTPYSTPGTKGPLHAGFAYPLRSALRVWLPSRRFAPLDTLPVLFRTGGAPGIPPSELSPLGRWTDVSARPHPPTVSLGAPPATGVAGRHAGPRFLGFNPLENPSLRDAWLARPRPDAPLGFALLGYPGDGLVQDFAQTPLACLAASSSEEGALACTTEYRSAFAWPHRPRRTKREGTRQPF
jgi:hypothetical protein